ncbi:hypothetical protein SAMD00019534_034450 [Acytostelium subglobosum LB1]|uniref:hypothetical protein n=1 Tax=Acytostelium subglobosum LB1 TaxID=1410327 RepID=UPI000644BD54|nr:hypothetical protein SAMD00019534_034450 [Acytostelium subglobosum LB1]GAM20270.1 hypothetical protein SAMD00019534_034450 [Acytostelium subglobosum LB1]|eukprot:XP_012759791.1 hypothetical protein SAMD00019534_034450 [Acytostelium subglobosum LB1]
MEIIQEQNQIFAAFQQYKNNQNRLAQSAGHVQTSKTNQQHGDSILFSSEPSSPTSDDPNDSSLEIHDDEKEIGMIANILLKISSNGIPTDGSAPNEDSDVIRRVSRSLNSSANDIGHRISLTSSLNNAPSCSSSSSAYKKKRQRTSPEQLAILEQIFETDKMPSQQIRMRLANQLGMSSRRVQIWFQNKRAKVKRGIFTKGDDDESMLDDEEDDDDNDGSLLTIDENAGISTPTLGSQPAHSSYTPFHMTPPPSQLSGELDNIVPSISPSSFNYKQSSGSKSLKSSTSSPSLLSLGMPMTLVNKRSHTPNSSRPASPTSDSPSNLLSLSPICLSSPTPGGLPLMPPLNLNSSSAHIPLNIKSSPYQDN